MRQLEQLLRCLTRSREALIVGKRGTRKTTGVGWTEVGLRPTYKAVEVWTITVLTSASSNASFTWPILLRA